MHQDTQHAGPLLRRWIVSLVLTIVATATTATAFTVHPANQPHPYPVQYADSFPGATFDAKIIACIAALPSSGGTCDARTLTGAQAMEHTIEVRGKRGAPVTLLLGRATITRASGAQFIYYSNGSIIGSGRESTVIRGNDAVAVFYPGNFTANPQNVTIANLHVENTHKHSGSIGLYIQTLTSRYSNLDIGPKFDTGVKIGGQIGACPCYNTFHDVFTSGEIYGADFSVDAAQNQWYGGRFSGPTGLYMQSGINQFFAPDFEHDGTAIEFTGKGGGNLLVAPYFEGNRHNVKLDRGAHGNSIIGGSWSGPNAPPAIINDSGTTDNFIFTTGSGPQHGGVAPLAFGAQTFVIGGNIAYNSPGNGASYITADGTFSKGVDFYWNHSNPGNRLGKASVQVGWLSSSGGLTDRGASRILSLPNPASPTIKQIGKTGRAIYIYYIVCHDYAGGVSKVSPPATTRSGTSTLSRHYYNIISYSCGPGWNTADILKGNTSTSLATAQKPNGTLEDKGQVTHTYIPPSRNTTGDITIQGMIISKGIGWPLPKHVVAGASFYCPNCDSPTSPPTPCSSHGDKTGSWVHGVHNRWVCIP